MKKNIYHLSVDQRLLYEYVHGIAEGEVTPRFAAYKIGPANNARWLTLAVRVLSLYVRGIFLSTEHQQCLNMIVSFICKVYAPSWFFIKRDKKFENQATYIFYQIQQIKKLPEVVQTPALNSLKFSAWSLLPENMLYFMVVSDKIEVREAALRKIIAIRHAPTAETKGKGKGKGRGKGKKRLTQLSNVEVDYGAKNWWELVKLDTPGIQECPMTKEIPTEDLRQALLGGTSVNLPVKLPSHSQSVERSVKLVTEASKRVYGFEQRHKHIHSVLLSREARPMFDCRASYVHSNL